MRFIRTSLGVAAAVGLLATAMAVPAQADTNQTVSTAGAVTGSDTLDDLMETLSGVSTLSGDLANYKTVTLGRTIDTSANYPTAAHRAAGADCVFSAPKNSGEGRNALFASLTETGFTPSAGSDASANMSGCTVVARSSSSSFPSTTGRPAGSIARFPVGVDAVAPAVLKSGSAPKKMTLDFLKAVYTRNGVAGTSACLNVSPLLPSYGSGTRSFWATALGVTDYDFSGTGGAVQAEPAASAVTWGSCVTGGTARANGYGTGIGSGQAGDRSGSTPIQEHQGTWLANAKQLVPYSVAQYIAQSGGAATDYRGGAVLGSVDFQTTDTGAPGTALAVTANLKHPMALNGTGSASVGYRHPSDSTRSLVRTVYAFVPRTLVTTAAEFATPADQLQFRRAGEGVGTGGTVTGYVSTADVDRFKQAFVSSTSDLCTAASSVLLQGFAVAPDCGTPTFG